MADADQKTTAQVMGEIVAALSELRQAMGECADAAQRLQQLLDRIEEEAKAKAVKGWLQKG